MAMLVEPIKRVPPLARAAERTKNTIIAALGWAFDNEAQARLAEQLAGNIATIYKESLTLEAEHLDAIEKAVGGTAAEALLPSEQMAKVAAAVGEPMLEWQDPVALAEADAAVAEMVDTGVVADAVLPDGWLGGK